MGKLTLRMARPGDAGLMLAIYAPYVAQSSATWEYAVPSRADFAARVDRHMRDGFPWLVAEEDGSLLGYAFAGRFGEQSGCAWNAAVSVYLTADAHGRRIGTALYTALLNLLQLQGFCSCYALVTTQDEGGIAFHSACGFTQIAHLPNAIHKNGRWLGLTCFYMNLRPYSPAPQRPVSFYELDLEKMADVYHRAANLALPARR